MSTDADGLFCSSLSKSSTTPQVSVHADAPDYNMNHPDRGICLILNYMEFSVPDMKRRNGSDRDRDALKNTFSKLGFHVIVPKDNLRKLETLREIEKVATKNHANSDCFALCFLSHGEAGGVIFASDAHLYYEDIFRLFTPDKCPTLAGKPKLFFFQACQGDYIDPGERLRLDGSNTSPFDYEYKIPLHADFFAAYATVPGYVSYRDGDETGSWFIKSLVSELEAKREYYDLASIMTFVCRKVAIEFQSNPMKAKQAPFWTSTLTRFVRFSQNAGNNNGNIINKNGYANGAGGPTVIDNSESNVLSGSSVDGPSGSGGDNNPPTENNIQV